LLEVAATRLMSFVSWHHFAFMVVSVAMLGLGAGSVLVATSERLRRSSLVTIGSWGGLLFGAGTVLAYLVVTWARFSPALLATDLAGQILRLAVTYGALLVPLLAGGVIIAACFSRLPGQAPLLYGGDLLGAALGTVAAVVVAGSLSSASTFLASGLLGALGSICFAWPRRRVVTGLALVLFLLGATAWVVPRLAPARAAPGKALALLTEGAGGRVLTTRHTALGRVDVVDAPTAVSWSHNPRAKAVVPRQLHLLIDGEADTPVALFPESEATDLSGPALRYLDVLPSSLVFALREPERVLVLGAGGGQDVLAALRHGARQVDAVEINPATVGLMGGPLAQASGRLYQRPGVRLVEAEGRSYVRSVPGQYDVVEMGLVDTWAATSTGAMSLTENYLYTVDAFADYLAALRPGGMVGVTRWLLDPPRETLRLTVLAAEALRRRGVQDVERHVVVAGAGRVGALVVSRDPMTAATVQRLTTLTRDRQLDLYWAPGLPQPRGARNPFREVLAAEGADSFVAEYPYDISAVTDDRPFFFDFNTPQGWSALTLLLRPRDVALSGTATLAAVLVQALLFAALLLVVPFVVRRVSLGGTGRRMAAYFVLTGLAFMLVEIPLLQRLTLVVGHPTHAVALVLGVLLAACGVGSWWSAVGGDWSRRRVVFVLGVLVCLTLAQAVGGTWLSQLLLSASEPVRYLAAAGIVFPMGLVMGVVTPQGLRLAGANRADLVPLCWALSSFASVVGSVVAVMIAMHSGFEGALLVGACCYSGAMWCVPR
jgi:spermidine synthase